MKCLICKEFSFLHICKACQRDFLTPSLHKQPLIGGIEVLSFYKYDDIKEFLHTKHTDLGYHIYKILAQNSFSEFAKQFSYDNEIAVLGIDDRIKGEYAHTAILSKALSSPILRPKFGKLIATNEISYSGKSKQFRLQNPRNFLMKDFVQKECILVDDIITTGTTLKEAVGVLLRNGKEPLLCITLATV